MNGRMILHCGAEVVTGDELRSMDTPKPTATHFPIPHFQLFEEMVDTLGQQRFEVDDVQHAVSSGGLRYFGLVRLQPHRQEESYGYQAALGIRNSHDRSFKAAVAFGSRVFVCDNLGFHGDVTMERKHTKHIFRDLPALMVETVGKFALARVKQVERIKHYRHEPADEARAKELIVDAYDMGAITLTMLPHVLHEWRRPEHDEFADRNMWSLFNAFTAAMRGSSMNQLASRTTRLHGLFDVASGFADAYENKEDLRIAA